MRRFPLYLFCVGCLGVALWGSGVIPAIIPAAVPTAFKTGNSTKFQLAGANSGTSGNALCNDANSNATDSGCTGAATSVNFSGVQPGTNTAGTMTCGSGCSLTTSGTGTINATNQLHVISFSISGASGGVITTGDILQYPTADFACTINRIDISAGQSGSITVDVWKAAGAIPTSGNKISASAPLTLTSAQLAQNGSRTGWTAAVAVGDVFGFSVASVTTVTSVTGQIWCQ